MNGPCIKFSNLCSVLRKSGGEIREDLEGVALGNLGEGAFVQVTLGWSLRIEQEGSLFLVVL